MNKEKLGWGLGALALLCAAIVVLCGKRKDPDSPAVEDESSADDLGLSARLQLVNNK